MCICYLLSWILTNKQSSKQVSVGGVWGMYTRHFGLIILCNIIVSFFFEETLISLVSKFTALCSWQPLPWNCGRSHCHGTIIEGIFCHFCPIRLASINHFSVAWTDSIFIDILLNRIDRYHFLEVYYYCIYISTNMHQILRCYLKTFKFWYVSFPFFGNRS